MKNAAILLVILVGALFVWGIISIAQLIIIKNKGSQIAAKVLKVDTDCDKYNHIEFVYDGKTYSVNISRANCEDRVYKIGQTVTLIKYKDNNDLVWPEVQVKLIPFVFLVLLAFVYFTNKNKFVKSNKALTKRRL